MYCITEDYKWEHGKRKFRLICQCSKERWIWDYILNRNVFKSCNCGIYVKTVFDISNTKFKVLTGLRFGRLLVMGPDKIKYYTRPHLYWICKCDCGIVKSVRGDSLTTTRSCGCLQKECAVVSGKKSYKGLNIYLINTLFGNYKRRAKQDNLEFDITLAEFKFLIKEECFYCSRINSNKIVNRSKSEEFLYNGIDRIDSSIGYLLNNVVTACTQCNYSKSDYTKEEFYSWIDRTYKNLKEKGLLNE